MENSVDCEIPDCNFETHVGVTAGGHELSLGQLLLRTIVFLDAAKIRPIPWRPPQYDVLTRQPASKLDVSKHEGLVALYMANRDIVIFGHRDRSVQTGSKSEVTVDEFLRNACLPGENIQRVG